MPKREPLDPGKYFFSTLMNDIENGRVRLPPFQREFVWSPPKVMSLMDSIYKGFPIGSFFYWKADRKYVTLFRDIESLSLPSPALDQELFFILDGQQRLTSIWATFKGTVINNDNYARICLDLDAAAEYEKGTPEERRLIRVFQETDADNCKFVSLRDILADNTRTYDDIRDQLPRDKKDTLSNAREQFIKYPYSVVKIFDLELEDAVEVFQRINQGGKRLTRFELVAANCWSESFDLAKSVRNFNGRVKERTDFGKVEPITFVQAMSLVAFGQCKTEHELKLSPGRVQVLWPRVSKAIGDAIDWARDNYGVVRGDMIPYDSMLAVLACYFSEHGTNVPLEHKLWIDKWFWRSAFSERYSKSTNSQMANDAKAIRELVNGKLELPTYPLTMGKDDLLRMRMNQASSAARSGVLCLLANAKPKHFVTGADIALAKDHFSELKDPNAHHIFPRNFLKKILKRPVEEVHLLANFCFVPADLNNKIRDRPPSEYFAEFKGKSDENPQFETALKSHLIPTVQPSPIWTNDYAEFLRQRAELIWAEILRVTGDGDIYSSGAPVPRDQARLAVDEIEVKLRRVVHGILQSQLGAEYWKVGVPSDVQETVKKRISERNRSKIVNRIEDPLIRLQYVDLMDYHKIIDKNWALFADIFGSREDLRSHSLALKNYRNPLSHVRDIDPIDQKRGEASVLWFRKTLVAFVNSAVAVDDEQPTVESSNISSSSPDDSEQSELGINLQSKFRGAMLGLAVGDAVGTTLEFKQPGSFAKIDDMVGGGPFHLAVGEWTDDTSMALCLAESLVEKRGFDPIDQLERYTQWAKHGHLSSNGRAFDIGNTVQAALAKFAKTHEPFCGSTDPMSAGNGSLMRLAPVPLFYVETPLEAIKRSGESSQTTHGVESAIDACRYFGGLIVGAILGTSKEELLSECYSPVKGYWRTNRLVREIDEIAAGSFKRLKPPEIKGTGYVVKCLAAALWAFYSSKSFREGCLLAVNLGDDADTTGAVYGQIAGAYYGEDDIPEDWRRKLAHNDLIKSFADGLLAHKAAP